jgi:chromosome segregation ATPase
MGVCLTNAIDKQRKVYDLGYPAYCESTLLPFSKKDFDGRDGKALPLEFPRPPPNFKSSIQFAINLLEFSANNGYLRSTFYWSLLSKTMVIEDLQSAQVYRQHLVQMRYPCPTILTRDGHVIASDGLMDPRRRCPKNLSELKFSFGALPPSEQTVNREIQDTLKHLEDLKQTVSEYEETTQLVKMKEDHLKQQRTSLSPQITSLERELRKLRPAPSANDTSESPDKRKRR